MEQNNEDSNTIIGQIKNEPYNKDIKTQRIIQYFEDSKEYDALDKIRMISSRAKGKSNANKSLDDLDDDDDIYLQNKTEKNSIMFIEPKNQNAVRLINNPEESNSIKTYKKFQTQILEPNIKNDQDNKFKKENLNENRNITDNEKKNKKRENKNDNKETKNKELNENKNYNKINNSRNYKVLTSLKKYKKMNTGEIEREKFINDTNKLRNSYIYEKPDRKKIVIYRDLRSSFNPAITEEYKKKNNMTIENINNKEKLIINEYHTKYNDKNKLKKFKSEYIWDKDINRLIEKRIYFNDDTDENEKDNYKINDKNNIIDDYINKDAKEETKNEYPEEKKEIKVNLKSEKEDDDNKKEKEKENKNIEIRKRYGKSEIIHKKEEMDNKKNEINNEKKIKNEEIDNKMKEKNIEEEKLKNNDYKEKENNKNENINENTKDELNKSKRYHRRFRNYNTNKTRPEKEIIIDKKTVANIKDEKNEDNKDKENKKKKEEEKNKEKEFASKKLYEKRYVLKLEENNKKGGEPKNTHERNLTEVNNEPKYKMKPLYEKIEEKEKPKVIYTKKIIIEDKKKNKEEIPEKKNEKENEILKEEKPKVYPYFGYRKKNIRINKISENFDDDEKYNNTKKIKNNPYSNYIKYSKKKEDNNIYRQAKTKTDSELIDDLEKIENYNVTTYLKNDLLQIYDSINEEFSDFKNDIFYTNINNFEVKMGEFDKKKIPYVKRTMKAEDLCKGRVTTDDMYKKYSKNAKTFRKFKNYK